MLSEGAILVQNAKKVSSKIICLILEGNNFCKAR